MKNLVRLSKIISHAGICSRRDAEKLIKKGEVKVNGEILKGFIIAQDKIKEISIKNVKLKKKKTKIWCFYKPKGFVCSNVEQYNQKSLFKLLPKNFERVVSVGRLDIPSEGLLLLTNNPTLSTFLENPKNKITRKYQVEFSGLIPDEFNNIKKGIEIEGIFYEPIDFKILKENCLEMHLIEGKNREIRRIFKFYNLKVLKLKRIEYGPFKIKKLIDGQIYLVDHSMQKKNLNIIGFKDENNFWKI